MKTAINIKIFSGRWLQFTSTGLKLQALGLSKHLIVHNYFYPSHFIQAVDSQVR